MSYDPRKRVKRQKNFGRDLRKKATDRQQRGGGGPMLGFRFRNRFKPPAPPEDNQQARVEPARIRLIPGDYVAMDGSPNSPYFEYFEHFVKRAMRGHICSKIWKELPDGEMVGSGKCASCWEIDENGARDVSRRRLAAFLILNYGWYYLVPATDKDGKVIRREKDSKYGKKCTIVYDRVPESEVIKEYGRAKINQYTKIATIPISIIQSFGMYGILRSQNIISSQSTLTLAAIITSMLAGTMIMIFLGTFAISICFNSSSRRAHGLIAQWTCLSALTRLPWQ